MNYYDQMHHRHLQPTHIIKGTSFVEEAEVGLNRNGHVISRAKLQSQILAGFWRRPYQPSLAEKQPIVFFASLLPPC